MPERQIKNAAGLHRSNSQRFTFTYSCFTPTFILEYLYVLGKKYLTCIPHEYKPFLQLSELNHFTTDAVENFFRSWKAKDAREYSEPSRTSKTELFAKMVNG